MPDIEGRERPHPFRADVRPAAPPPPEKAPTDGSPPRGAPPRDASSRDIRFVELLCRSNYTFLTGASHPEEYMVQAGALGYRACGLADTNSLAGVVRAHCGAKDAGLRFILGSRLLLQCGLELAVYPTTRDAYRHLCRLLTLGKRRAPKGECHLTLEDVAAHHAELLAIAIPPAPSPRSTTLSHKAAPEFEQALRSLRDIFDDGRLSLAASFAYAAEDAARLAALSTLSKRLGIPLVATSDPLMHAPDRYALQDVLTCIRLGVTIEEAGFALEPNVERYLKPPDEMLRLFAEHPKALSRTLEIEERTRGFSLDQLRYEYPDEVCPAGLSPTDYLRALTEEGLRRDFPGGETPAVRAQIENELSIIKDLKYEPYFLTVYDLVKFARSRGILCQGRGAAANSAVCFCLGVTSVNPAQGNLLFERFISRERNEPPDIDIDFEHERREEVIQYIYAKYGRDRAALTAEVITYRGKSAIREVGKAMGLSLDCVDSLSKTLGWWDRGDIPTERLKELGLDPNDRTMRLVLALADQIHGFPRHLSQHVGGFVITRGPLCEMVPVENAAMEDRTVIEWDKDDLDAMGMLKVDCLGLGMLTCIRKCFELVKRHHGPALTLANIPQEDPAVYDMLCRADSIGVFQVESRAQMSMLPRLKPRTFYDLVIEVAIVRPGPIQGKMVHPYLRRRNHEEQFFYPNDEVKQVLGRTLGVPLFQEQAMSLAIVAAGFTAGEADQLRRAMAAWKRKGDLIYRFGRKLHEGMRKNGYSEEFSERCFEQIKGFSQYGFPESHAASFALLVYVSSWLKCHYPAAFTAALLNSLPMGFYQPAQLVQCAKDHGVKILAVDVNRSDWHSTLEVPEGDGLGEQLGEIELQHADEVCDRPRPLLRLGMKLVSGMGEEAANALVREREARGPFTSVDELRRRTGLERRPLRALARADAFQSMGLDRQRALWEIQALDDAPSPMFEDATPSAGEGASLATRDGENEEPELCERVDPAAHGTPLVLPGETLLLPFVTLSQRVTQDYAATGLSLKAHPISFVRERLTTKKVLTAKALQDEQACPRGRRVAVAGLVLLRQRPSTASGIVFMTLEDETGIANLVIHPNTFERYRRIAKGSNVVCVWGRIDRNGPVVHVVVSRFESLTTWHDGLRVWSRDFH